jgi:hypothetical protein
VVGIFLAFLPAVGDYNIALTWVGIAIGYYVFSVRWWNPVNETQIAARIFFGQNAGDIQPGITFAPLGLIKVVPVPVRVVQKEIPGEPNKLYRGDLKDASVDLSDKAIPIRVTFRKSLTEAEARKIFKADSPDEKENKYIAETKGGKPIEFNPNAGDDGLSSRITAEPVMFVRYRPENAYAFVRNIGDTASATKQIEDTMVATLQEYCSNMSYAQALANMRWLSIHLYNAVARRIGDYDEADHETSWGIELLDVNLKSIELDHTTNQAIRDAASASFTAQATVTAAEADRKKAILLGEGAANAAELLEKQTLIGRADGQKKLADSLGITGAEVQAAEVAREIAKGGNAIIFGGDGLAQAASVVSAMTRNKSSDKKEDK